MDDVSPDRFNEIIKRLCDGRFLCEPAANSTFRTFASSPDAKAIAVPVSGVGYGYKTGEGSLMRAIQRALYKCNFVGSGRLCKLVGANNYMLNDLYDEFVVENVAAIEKLSSASFSEGQVWEDESTDWAIQLPTQLRTDPVESSTPIRLRAVTTVTTKDFVPLVREGIVLIDVGGAESRMLPSAKHFWNGGIAFNESDEDTKYDERFQKMIKAAAPDRAKPLAFYCGSATCWGAVNAAQRAVKAGYEKVIWYRGGLTFM